MKKYLRAYKCIPFLFLLLTGNYGYAQCLTNSLIINTGYNPITGTAITGGANGAPAVIDPHWVVTAVSPATTAAITATVPSIPGLVGVVPVNNADVVTPIGGAWVANPVGNPGNWISCMNSNTYNDQGTGLLYTMTLGRPFRMCADDNITFTFYISSDNLTTGANIDGITTLPTPSTGYGAYTFYTQTVFLTAGTHTINFVVQNQNITTGVTSNPTGMNVYGTISSGSGTNSLVSESYASCATYNCGSVCNTLSLPDSLHLCQGGSDTLRGSVTGTDSVLSISWTPATHLSSTTVLRPFLSNATTSGWYDLTVESLIPYSLVANGDFSAGNTGFSSTYTYVTGYNSLQPEATYAVTTNPFNVHTGAVSFGDHTTGTGNMMAINGSGSPTSVWCETIPVTPNTDYAFSAWAANWSTASTGASAPILQFQIDGVLIGSALTITSAAGVWIHFYATWNSGSNTTATICIYDACTALNGNDFALDDISFQKECISTDSIYVDVHLPDTTYNHRDTAACPPVTAVTLTAPAGYSSYLWNTGTSGQTIVAPATGVYWVYAPGTCAMFIDTFYVSAAHVDTTLKHSDTSVCAYPFAAVTLTAPPGNYTSYLWTTGSTTSSTTVTNQGTYWLGAPGACTMLIDTFHVVFRPLPPAPNTRDTFYCKDYPFPAPLTAQVDSLPGSNLTWYSTIGGLALPGTPPVIDATPNYPAGQTWYVTQTVNGCEGLPVAVRVTTVAPPAFQIISQPWVCDHDSISLTYTISDSLVNGAFHWSLPPGSTIVGGTSLTDDSIVVRFDSVDAFNIVTLTISDLIGGECANDTTKKIDVIQLPTAMATSKADVCKGDTVLLALASHSESANDYSWYVDNLPMSGSSALTIISANSNSGGPFSIAWNDTGRHFISVEAYAEHRCTDKPVADSVDVHELPDASFRITTLSGALCLEDSVLFSANDSSYANLYSWEPAHFFRTANEHAMWGRVEQAQSIITLTVTDPFGCHASVSQELDPGTCCTIQFPNAFTPNGDNLNDIFRPIPSTGNHTYHTFQITNRWGQVVFESTNNKASWDGTFNGVPQDIGVYFYYLKYDCGGKTLEEKGDVTLIR